jgi:predicted aspartyl protease
MSRIRTICAVLAVMTSAAWADQSCNLAMVASLPMDPAVPQRVMIDATLNDTPVKMIVDTGAPATMLNESAVERFKLHREGIARNPGIHDSAGRSVNRFAIIPSLQTGNLHSTNVHALIMPHEIQPRPTVGLIGPDLLSHYEVELDFATAKMNLFSQDHCPGQVVYWTHDPVAVVPIRIDPFGHLRLDVELDGKTFDAYFDTGAPGATISLRKAEEEFGITRQSLNMAENQPVAFHTFNSLSFGGIAISNPKVAVIGGDLKSPLIVGLWEMRHLHLIISYKEKMLYATAAGAH